MPNDNLEINDGYAPLEVYGKKAKKETEEKIEPLTLSGKFNKFIKDYDELKEKEREVKKEFREQLKNGTKYILYKDKRRISKYENREALLLAIIYFLIFVMATVINLTIILNWR